MLDINNTDNIDQNSSDTDNLRVSSDCIPPSPYNVTSPGDYDDEETLEGEDEIIGFGTSTQSSSRIEEWERRLLDLSLRNPMLNMRVGKAFLPLLTDDPSEVISRLKSGRLTKLIGTSPKNSSDLLKSLYRASITRIEENGANSFYITIGSLKWFDVTGKAKPHIAPIIFLPADIDRRGDLSYRISLRDDEVLINVTLLEMLSQKFGIVLPQLNELPLTEEGMPDWERIIDFFNAPVEEINKRMSPERQWSVSKDSFAGVFIFQKYLLWRDIHNNQSIITDHPILSAMIARHYEAPCDSMSSKEFEDFGYLNLMLPIDYDSSQLEAIAACHAGKSFVLHGPPGTGKSQTISNMIADAIFNGKKVLFVSEKKAALDVVRKRLNSIGLENYCLELHSNKSDKRSFFSQILNADPVSLGSGKLISTDYAYSKLAHSVSNSADKIYRVTEALHAPVNSDSSLYNLINRFFELDNVTGLKLRYKEISHLSHEHIRKLATLLESLDLIAEVLGNHPADHPFWGLYPKENNPENRQALTTIIDRLPEEFMKIRKKADGFLNRFLFRKTPEDILLRNPIWCRLSEYASIQLQDQSFSNLETISAKWVENIDYIDKWYLFTEKKGEIEAFKIPLLMNLYFQDKSSGSQLAGQLEKGYLHSYISHQLHSLPQLRLFSGILHEYEIEKYKAEAVTLKDTSLLHMKKVIANRKASLSLTPLQIEQKALLKRRASSQGRRITLRKTIAEADAIIHDLFPCMLMSPLSAAQYLEMRQGMFDIVIFDEASQMETPDAVGAIARGKTLIVVGDPKQLPPTRFFTARVGNGEFSRECEDADSILEECIDLGLPSHYLSRHYRSRHESLISFSNAQFYDDKLLTFPSFNDSHRKVTFINPEGVYDIGKTRTNLIEAQAVADYVLQRVKDSQRKPFSIGIVTFSKVQSELIEDLINDRLTADPLTAFLLSRMEEPLFIKNLENVQGDERDIIIFSIGYGPDAKGNVSLNFGPINKIGGERRLNVAVTRAREEMVIFSSLLPHHIPEVENTPKGVTALRNFLKFASENRDSYTRESTDSPEERVISEMARRLEESGYTVHTHVGRSSFKVDLAVVNPEKNDEYCLGIVVDGNDYHKLPTVRDREITVPGVLAGLGWKTMKAWTVDWFENPDKVIFNILRRLTYIKTHS